MSFGNIRFDRFNPENTSFYKNAGIFFYFEATGASKLFVMVCVFYYFQSVSFKLSALLESEKIQQYHKKGREGITVKFCVKGGGGK